jgi:hypothetical protein
MKKIVTILIAISFFAISINLFAQEKNNVNMRVQKMDVGVPNLQKAPDGPTAINTFNNTLGSSWIFSWNWSLGHVPLSTEDVIINANCNMNMAGGVCKSLTVNATRTLTMISTYDLTVSGDVVNNGTIRFQAGSTTYPTWLFLTGNFTNALGATFTETANNCRFSFIGTGTQTFTNSGTITSPMTDLSVNSGGLTISNNIVVTRLNLFWGTISNSNKITLGTGGTSYASIQRGVDSSTFAVGNFDIPPTFNIGSGGLYLIYDYANADYTIDKEVPASGIVHYMIFYPTMARTITLAKTVTTTDTLEFATGNVGKFALGANNLTINPSGTILGASASSYVKTNGTGQLKRTVNNNNSYVFFPVGLSAYNPLNIKLNVNSTTKIFGVKISDAISNPGYVPTKTVSRQWDITRATSDIDSATIQFQFNAGEGLSDYGTGEIGHWNSSFSFYDAISAGISGSGPYVITNIQPITTFSPFIVGNSGSMPVELSSFTANVISRDVKLNWTTATETNNAGFEIQKYTQNDNWTKVGYISGYGTKTTPTSYTFEDKKLNTGKYNYRLKQTDYNGNFEYFNLTGEIEIGVPNKFDISQNYPNPFNPTTKIDFNLPYDSKVSMKLYDISGREVMALVNETKAAGYYTVQMNGNNLSSGMYFYRIVAEGNGQNFISTKKLILIK